MTDDRENPSPRTDVEDAGRRVVKHRTMMAEIVEAQLQTLVELKGLLDASERQGLQEPGAVEVEAEIRRTRVAARLLSAGPAAPQRRVPKVLLVDDDPTTRNIISHFLRKEEFIVEKAADGNEGLAKARSGRPDILILDAVVPGLSGFELLTVLKKNPATAEIPVLLLSALGEEEAIIKGLEEGADYLVKPFSPQILVAMVRKILREADVHAVGRGLL